MNLGKSFIILSLLLIASKIPAMEKIMYIDPINNLEEKKQYFMLNSREGHIFYIERKAANFSNTLKNIGDEISDIHWQSWIDTSVLRKMHSSNALQKIMKLLTMIINKDLPLLDNLPNFINLLKVNDEFELNDFTFSSDYLDLNWSAIFNQIEQNNPPLMLELINSEFNKSQDVDVISNDNVTFTMPFTLARYLRNFEF